jgi:hypothetical protein
MESEAGLYDFDAFSSREPVSVSLEGSVAAGFCDLALASSGLTESARN